MFVFSVFVIVIFASLFYLVDSWIRQWSRLRHIPGPPGVGWTKLWLLKQAWSGKICDNLHDASRKYGPLVRIGPDWVLCADPSEVRRIWGISSDYRRSEWYKAVRLNSDVDNVLTVIENHEHHRLRSRLTPAYGGKGLVSEEGLVNQQILALIELITRKYLSTKISFRPCDLARTMQYLTQDVITAVGFGTDAGYLEADRDLYGIIQTSEALHRPVHMVTLLPWLRKILESRLLKPFHPKPSNGRGVGRFLGYIKSRVEERYRDNEAHHSDMLQSFIKSGLTRPQVESAALVAVFGGTDTTSTALRIIIFYLSITPRAYRELQDDIDAAVIKVTRPVITDSEAKALPYLQACIKEGCVSTREDIIYGMKVPANTQVAWSALAIMRNQAIFGEDADVYEPQGWIDASSQQRKQMDCAYGLAFATGTRWECLGKRLAYIEMGKTIFELAEVTVSPAAKDASSNSASSDDANAAQNNAHPSPPRQHRPDPPRLTTAAIAWTMMSLCLSVLLSALDLTIVAPAIPSIVSTFKSVSGYIWVGSAYTLAHAGITPVWGSVSDIWGRKPIMLLAVSVFLVGSLICALAPQMDALIVGRAIQGLGGSGIGIMVNIVVSDMFSLRDRGLYLAITSLVWAVGSAIGPVLGGVFTTQLSWRWYFWINLPVGAVSFVVLLFFMKLPNPRTPLAAGLKIIDWVGSILIIGGSLMVLLALDFGDVIYSWFSATVICLLVFGTMVLGLFLLNEWKIAKNPIIPLWLFDSPTKLAPYVVFACNSYVFIGQAYYLPLNAQSVLAASALTSGLYLLPLIVSCSLAAAAAGLYIQRTGKYLPVMYVAQGFLLLGSGLLISLEFESNITKLVIFQVLIGVGVGMNIDAPIIAGQAATSARDTAAVTATMGFVRSLSTAISVVVGGVVFQNKMHAMNSDLGSQLGGNSSLAEKFDGGLAAASVAEIGTLGLSAEQENIVRKTYFEALRIVWVMYVAFAGLATVLNLFVRAHKLRSESEGAVLGADRVANNQRRDEDERVR
ncbi:cytochrome P450 [Aspergillus karnatakaensis]|uniref:cytochrome P450 n=1 Tax=Aspergillus karnatakaensis TaxID=1810916 RepID=UPI003CCD45D2